MKIIIAKLIKAARFFQLIKKYNENLNSMCNLMQHSNQIIKKNDFMFLCIYFANK
jgi:hypothetical protein